MDLFIANAVYCLGACFHLVFFPTNWVSKAFPVFSLCWFQYVKLDSALNPRYSLFLCFGFLLCCMGDIALCLHDNSGEKWQFIAGLVLFLVAHIAYIQAFRLEKEGLVSIYRPLVVVILVYFSVMMMILLPSVEKELIVPVIIYGITISLMAFFAINRLFNSGKERDITSKRKAACGALLFVISDTILALGKFSHKEELEENGHLLVMITYYLANLLLSNSVDFAVNEDYSKKS